jgi:hypothetical protein
MRRLFCSSMDTIYSFQVVSTKAGQDQYAHLKPELFGAADLERANVPLTAA